MVAPNPFYNWMYQAQAVRWYPSCDEDLPVRHWQYRYGDEGRELTDPFGTVFKDTEDFIKEMRADFQEILGIFANARQGAQPWFFHVYSTYDGQLTRHYKEYTTIYGNQIATGVRGPYPPSPQSALDSRIYQSFDAEEQKYTLMTPDAFFKKYDGESGFGVGHAGVFFAEMFPPDHIRGNIVAVQDHNYAYTDASTPVPYTQTMEDSVPRRIDTVTCEVFPGNNLTELVYFELGTLEYSTSGFGKESYWFRIKNDKGFQVLKWYDPDKPEEGGFDPTQCKVYSSTVGIKQMIVDEQYIWVELDTTFPVTPSSASDRIYLIYVHDITDADGNFISKKLRLDDEGKEVETGGKEYYAVNDGSDGFFVLHRDVTTQDAPDLAADYYENPFAFTVETQGKKVSVVARTTGTGGYIVINSQYRLSFLEAVTNNNGDLDDEIVVTEIMSVLAAAYKADYTNVEYVKVDGPQNKEYNVQGKMNWVDRLMFDMYYQLYSSGFSAMYVNGDVLHYDYLRYLLRGGALTDDLLTMRYTPHYKDGERVKLHGDNAVQHSPGNVDHMRPEGGQANDTGVLQVWAQYRGWDWFEQSTSVRRVFKTGYGGGLPPDNTITRYRTPSDGAEGATYTPDDAGYNQFSYDMVHPYGQIKFYSSLYDVSTTETHYVKGYGWGTLGDWYVMDNQYRNRVYNESGHIALTVDLLFQFLRSDTQPHAPTFNIDWNTNLPTARIYGPGFLQSYYDGFYHGGPDFLWRGRWWFNDEPNSYIDHQLYVHEWATFDDGPGELTLSKSRLDTCNNLSVDAGPSFRRIALRDQVPPEGENISVTVWESGSYSRIYEYENYLWSGAETAWINEGSANLFEDGLVTSALGPITYWGSWDWPAFFTDHLGLVAVTFTSLDVSAGPPPLYNKFAQAPSTSSLNFDSGIVTLNEPAKFFCNYGEPLEVINDETRLASVEIQGETIVWTPLRDEPFHDTVYVRLEHTSFAISVTNMAKQQLARLRSGDDTWQGLDNRIEVSNRYNNGGTVSRTYDCEPYAGEITEETTDPETGVVTIKAVVTDWEIELVHPEIDDSTYSEDRIIRVKGCNLPQRHRVFATSTEAVGNYFYVDEGFQDVVEGVRDPETGDWVLDLSDYPAGLKFYIFIWEYNTSAALRSFQYTALPPLGYEIEVDENQPPEPSPQTVPDGGGVTI